jgi:hypothetical protein
MSDLMIKIGNKGGYDDNDVFDAFSRYRIHKTHIEHICDPTKSGFTAEGLRPDGLSRIYCESVYEYRCETISATEYKRTHLGTLDEIIVGPPPQYDIEINTPYVHLAEKLDWMLRNPRHQVFGTLGSEVWYGGRQRFTKPIAAYLWTEIEARTVYRKVNFRRWPAQRRDLKEFLMIPVQDFSEARAEHLIQPLLHPTDVDEQGNPIVVKRRKCFLPWRLIAGLTAEDLIDIPNRAKRVELRHRIAEIQESLDVQEKEVT